MNGEILMYGEKILMPYLLDRKIAVIDYMFISHFDTDHCQGLLYILQEMKVRNVMIGKQFENSENYQKFIQIIKQKKLNLNVLEAGAKIAIEKNLYFEILWPKSSKKVEENVLNNNSLVGKIVYQRFSMLFTGDIEKLAEEEIKKLYSSTNLLNTTVLKVAHHGSKTSSTEEFLKLVQPRLALIGVGRNNLYGHPDDEVIERLRKLEAKVYRTDEGGEISIIVNKEGKIRIKKFINTR